MAGRPKRRAMIAELERLAREDEQESVLAFVLEWTKSGRTMLQLAEKISEGIESEVMRGTLDTYVRTLAPDATEQLRDARKIGAHGMLEESIDVTDKAGDKDQAAVARGKASSRQWAAERWNREEMGQPKPGAGLTININTLHLDALRARVIEEVTGGDEVMHARVQTVDAEVLELGEGESAIASAIADGVEQLTLL